MVFWLSYVERGECDEGINFYKTLALENYVRLRYNDKPVADG